MPKSHQITGEYVDDKDRKLSLRIRMRQRSRRIRSVCMDLKELQTILLRWQKKSVLQKSYSEAMTGESTIFSHQRGAFDTDDVGQGRLRRVASSTMVPRPCVTRLLRMQYVTHIPALARPPLIPFVPLQLHILLLTTSTSPPKISSKVSYHSLLTSCTSRQARSRRASKMNSRSGSF